ncbi:MAG: M10 family metallopeptidase C-terminal domain-containing protein, partial [Thermoleophilia bacterium]|nr:M10 family metallopeptidase C-terminal domain-containing protein [Thermoleophilia bacterium]
LPIPPPEGVGPRRRDARPGRRAPGGTVGPTRPRTAQRRHTAGVEPLERRLALSTLAIDCGGQDNLVSLAAAESKLVVTVNGVSINYSLKGRDEIVITGGSGRDTFRIGALNDPCPITIHGGGGDDTFEVTLSGGPDALHPSTTLIGGEGNDRLRVIDANRGYSGPYQVTETWVSRVGSRPAVYFDLEGVALEAADGDNTIYVTRSAPGVAIDVHGGGGNDLFMVTPFEDLGAISAPLTIDGGGGTNALVVNDRATVSDAFDPALYRITDVGVFRGGGASAVAVSFSRMASVSLLLGDGAANIEVASTPAGTDVTVDGGAGDDSFFITPTGKSLDTLGGALTIIGGGGFDRLKIDDAANARPEAYTLTNTQTTRPNAAPIAYQGIGRVEIFGGSAGHRYDVQSAAGGVAFWVQGGAGNDTILGGAGDEILAGGDGNDLIAGGGGSDLVYGQGGSDVFVFTPDDLADDAIADFVKGLDRIDLTAFGTSLDQLLTQPSPETWSLVV